MSRIRSQIEALEAAVFGPGGDGVADASLVWEPHELPPATIPPNINRATARLLSDTAYMDASVPCEADCDCTRCKRLAEIMGLYDRGEDMHEA